MNNAIGEFPFEDILVDFENADYAAECWTHLLLQITREYIPCKTVKIHPQDKKWINIKTLKSPSKQEIDYTIVIEEQNRIITITAT